MVNGADTISGEFNRDDVIFRTAKAAPIGKIAVGVAFGSGEDLDKITLEAVRVVEPGMGRFDPDDPEIAAHIVMSEGRPIRTFPRPAWQIFIDAISIGEFDLNQDDNG